MREQEMAVNVAKQIYFDEFDSFYSIVETKEDSNTVDVFEEIRTCYDITEEFICRLNRCNSFTKEGLNKERIIALYNALFEDGTQYREIQIKCYIEYTDKIIDEILKQVVVLGGEQNSSN